ncbi:DUF202 domain-containing protein [Vibrio sp. E150_011]
MTTRDKGLQPQRTSMSWLRTQLVLLLVVFAYLRVTLAMEYPTLICLLAGAFTMMGSLYAQNRFSQDFSNSMAVSRLESFIKISLSAIVLLLSTSYLFIVWHSFLF